MTRFTETKKWADPWFRSLSPDSKLVFLYIIDNCDNAGFWEIDLGMMAFQTGISEGGLQGALKGLARGLLVSGGWVWVKNFLRHQRNERVSETNPAHKQIITLLKSQTERFPSLIPFLEERGMEGALKGLLSPHRYSKGNGQSSEGDTRGNQPDPCTVDQAIAAGQNFGVTKQACEYWFASRKSTGWTVASNGVVRPITDWQSDLSRSKKWAESEAAKTTGKPKTGVDRPGFSSKDVL